MKGGSVRPTLPSFDNILYREALEKWSIWPRFPLFCLPALPQRAKSAKYSSSSWVRSLCICTIDGYIVTCPVACLEALFASVLSRCCPDMGLLLKEAPRGDGLGDPSPVGSRKAPLRHLWVPRGYSSLPRLRLTPCAASPRVSDILFLGTLVP